MAFRKEEVSADFFNETGILFIRQELEDYDEGIEFVSINGFLFSKGRIYNSLAKFRQIIQKNVYDRESRNIVIGRMDKYYDVHDELEENFDAYLEGDEDFGYYGMT